MGRGVVFLLACVVRPGNDFALTNDYRADGDFALSGGQFGFPQRFPHVTFMVCHALASSGESHLWSKNIVA